LTGVPASSDALRVEVSPPVAWLIFDDTEHGNPVDDKFVAEIAAAWAKLAECPGLGAIGVRARGPSFSVGAWAT
jgi:enoyl-CoA hydratase/carnithine racemase